MTIVCDTADVVATSPTQFIGRDRELHVLRAAIEDEREVTTWLVGGDAGVGKTRLVEAFAERVDADEATIVRGACIHTAHGSLPYVAIAEALGALCRGCDPASLATPAADYDELGLLLPDSAVGAPAAPVAAADATSQVRLFDAITSLLVRMARERPIVVVLEDLHWADPSTRDLLVYMVRHLSGSRAKLIGTYRTDEMSRSHPFRSVLADFDRDPRIEHFSLRPFDDAELAAFATAHLDAAPSARTLDEIADRSGGNAFYAVELLDALAAGRRAVRPELSDLILSRIGGLAAATQEVLRLLSVGGESVRDELLEIVAELGESELTAALREAIDEQVVTIAGDGPLRFRHALMQEAVYGTLLPRERQRAHARYAHALIDRPHLATGRDGGDAELAWHLREAHDYERALAASVVAARSAESLLAFSEALGHVDAALELWADADDPEALTGLTHLELLQRGAELAGLAGDFPRGVTFERAAILEAADRPAAERGLLHVRLGRFLQASGRATEALAEYRRGVEIVPPDPRSPDRAVALAGLGQQLMLTMNGDEAAAPLAEAIEIARRSGDRPTEGHALNTLGTVMLHRGRRAEGIPMLVEALEIATRAGATEDRLRAYVNLGSGLTAVGELVRAERANREGLALARELGQEAAGGFFIAANLCETLCDMGRWDEATALARELKRPEGTLARTWMLHHSVKIAIRSGDLDRARRILDELDVDALGHIDPQIVHVSCAGYAELARSVGDVEAARRAIARGLETTDVLAEEMSLRASLIEIEAGTARTGVDRETAHRRAAAELAVMERTVREKLGETTDPGPRVGGLLSEARAEVAEVGQLDAADAWRDAVSRWAEGGFAWHRAGALARLGAVLLQQGERSEAAEALGECVAVAADIGAVPLEDRARELLRHAGLVDERGGEDDAGGLERAAGGDVHLTAREMAVLELVADGRTNRQIGEELFMSPKTASVHVSRILQKLGVSNRTEAAAAARRAGLVA